MNKIFSILAAIGFAVSASSASSADLPSTKFAPIAPITTNEPFFIGGNVGGATNSTGFVLGTTAGYDFGYIRLEGDYRNIGLGKNSPNFVTGNVLTGNVVVQYPFGKLTPYAFGGYGYAWQPYANSGAVWNVGGGSRYALTQNVSLDARYTFTEGTSGANLVNNTLTGGVEYRF